ncbi:MAG: efflux RND transporter periplasmic adaptor subunit [Phenylobacterium sp.]|uniref:efflux RND transporter periplasmic adaptor subunit n=1 Tax=Phenylobacterium sp. TaxID=1871053 RepID=UPI00391D9C55
MKLDKRKALLIGLAVVLALAAAWGVKAVFFSGPKAPAMATAVAARGDVEKTVLATGSLEPVTLVSVGAQVSGQVTSLKVELGQEVKKGELIAEIDSAPQKNSLRTAEASAANYRAQRLEVQANLAQAELAFARQAQMLKADATSQAEYETAEAAAKAAHAQLAALNAQIASADVAVETARINLGYTQIRAPIDGTVVAIVTKEGQTVNANQSAPTIVKLADLKTMTVKAEISEADVIKVKPGQQVYFTILGDPDTRYYAKLRAVEPAPESIESEDSSSSSTSSSSEAIYYNALFDVPNAEGRLRTYMTAQVYVVLAKAEGVLTVPSAALGDKTRDGGYRVMVVGEDGKPEPRRVEVGVDDGTNAQVLSGLKAGDKVVLAQAPAGGEAAAAGNGGGSRRGPPGPFGF